MMSLDPNTPILVVDDYKTMVKIVRHLLGQLGYKNVDDASNGAEAFDKMQTKQYGLVISDWNMEPVTGYELLKRMRASDAHEDIPFIMVTAESKPENITAARRAGVNNYLIKPFNQQSLKSKIDQVFDNAKTAAA
jgi:two-component system chemotaxis response regulator CheY